MSETQNEAWAPTWRGSSFHIQPEELNGRSRPWLLLAPRLPSGSSVVTVLVDLQGFEEHRGQECLSAFNKGSEAALLSAVSCIKRLDPSPAFGKRSGMPVPKTQLLVSWVCFASFCGEESVQRCSQTDIFPAISQRLYWGSLSKDLAFTTFTLNFSFQSVSLSDFILSKYAKPVRTVYL